MTEMRGITTGLCFPEGPVAMRDGSIVLVEIERQTVTRVLPNGRTEVIARTGGGPNGLAVGPDGAFYVCNNGGFAFRYEQGLLRPSAQASDYAGGRIERVDPDTGTTTILYDRCGDHKLRGPNDIVFDGHGGFYFTDLGKSRARDRDHGGLYYALADGSRIAEVAYPLLTPNGVGLSPDGNTAYVAETETARLWAFDLEGPGVARKQPFPSPHGGRLVIGLGGVPTLRQPGRRCRWKYLHSHAGQRLYQRDSGGWAVAASSAYRRSNDNEYLFRRLRTAHRVRHAVRYRPAGGIRLARGRTADGAPSVAQSLTR